MSPILTWRPTNAPIASSRTDDIWFLDPQVGWAVNSNGHILKTQDGGDSWVRQLATQAYLRCIGFANAQIGWAGTLTFPRRLFHTTNGGANWSLVQNLPAQAPAKICGIAVVSESVVYAAGTNEPTDQPRMMKTIDGGRTWTAWDMRAHASILIDTFFLDDRRGWVVGGKADDPAPLTRDELKPVILFTEDGGTTWVNRLAGQEVDFPFGEWGWKIQFLSDQLGFVSLENFIDAAIVKTSDGGLTWTRIPVVDPQGNANLEGVGFVDELRGWVGGWGDREFTGRYSSATEDGGATWRNANEIGKAINRFRFFGNPVTAGYASGESVYKYSAEPVRVASAPPLGPILLRQREIEVTSFPAAIPFRVPQGTARVAVEIWDRFGRYIGCVFDETRPASGPREYQWDGCDTAARSVRDGSYLYRVTADADAESGVLEIRTRPKRRRTANVTWIRHEIRVPRTSPLRAFTLSGVASATPVAQTIYIDIPNLSAFPTPVQKAQFLLHAAAEVEHALLAQYLYAAYSLKRPTDVTDAQQKAALRRWTELLLGVAREEMGHLMTVQNLLLLTGQPLNFEREDFPQIPKLYPFKMQLEPLQQRSLAKYVVAESPTDTAGIQDIVDQATQGAGMVVNKVGGLYALLGVVFTKQGELADNASSGDPWFTIVREVGGLAYRQDPDPSHWHLSDAAFLAGTLSRQASDAEWAPSRAIRVLTANTRQGALDSLKDIAIQGEGPVQPVADPNGSHFQRFLAAYRGDASNPPFPTTEWQPTRNVPTNPLLEGNSADPNVIHSPKANALARFADVRYALLLGFLEQYFQLEAGQRGFLIEWCFSEMGSLKDLSDRLTKLSRSADPAQVAALPFTLPAVLRLPPDPAAQWEIHIERLNQAIALAQSIIDNHTQGDNSLKVLLNEMKGEDQEKLNLAEQGRQGQLPTVSLGQWEQVRQILNGATGFGRPRHEGTFRFWKLSLPEFMQVELEGETIIAPPGPDRGKNSNLIKVLKGEPPFDTAIFPMPRNRPSIDPEFIAFIEKWIDDGCPEV